MQWGMILHRMEAAMYLPSGTDAAERRPSSDYRRKPMIKCPKCDNGFDVRVMYCRGDSPCRHDVYGEHLYRFCHCGFEGMPSPCKDAPKPEAADGA